MADPRLAFTAADVQELLHALARAVEPAVIARIQAQINGAGRLGLMNTAQIATLQKAIANRVAALQALGKAS
jgi:hypothetical protein